MRAKNTLLAVFLLGVIAVLVLGACVGQTRNPQTGAGTQSGSLPETGGTQVPSATEAGPATPVTTESSGQIGSTNELVEALKSKGVTVEPAGEVEQDFFGPTGNIIKVNGADVQLFEYPDEAARESDSMKVSPDGSSIGTSMVTWVDQPNFWAKDRLIVLYVGKDAGTIDLLSEVLGEPITSH